MDWEKERQRLANSYAGMEDAELLRIGAEAAELTDAAKNALNAELLRRGLPLPLGTEEPALTLADEKDHPRNLVVVRKYRDLPEASVAKSILDSAEIESFLVDENIVRLDWFYSNLVGNIKLLVSEEDAEAADKLLSEGVPERFETDKTGEYQQPRCPNCQSWDVTLDGLDKRLTYTFLMFGLPVQVPNHGWKCHSCGHEWAEEDPHPIDK
ncbi:MAG TPA: DUF2007 domain-containing protein [Candidatus Acidoferrum sp.]|nr:DUF2007 domain-containing protein [Candidatus Acidoferrum sp.]